jgi:hypothetical protein
MREVSSGAAPPRSRPASPAQGIGQEAGGIAAHDAPLQAAAAEFARRAEGGDPQAQGLQALVGNLLADPAPVQGEPPLDEAQVELAHDLAAYVGQGRLPPDRQLAHALRDIETASEGGMTEQARGQVVCTLLSRAMQPAATLASNGLMCMLRSLISVAPATFVRQIVAKAIDDAVQSYGVGRGAAMGMAGCFAFMPVMGLLLSTMVDHCRDNATGFSSGTKLLLALMAAGMAGVGLATSTLTPGNAFAWSVLYPLIRDPIQSMLPMKAEPDPPTTWKSLWTEGGLYGVNQAALSRAWQLERSPGRFAANSVMNAVGEAADLMGYFYPKHVEAHGATQPRVSIEAGSTRQMLERLSQDARTQLFWDTALSRGAFVFAANQSYESNMPLLQSALGDTTGDWLHEGLMAAATFLVMPFWPDPQPPSGRGRGPWRCEPNDGPLP